MNERVSDRKLELECREECLIYGPDRDDLYRCVRERGHPGKHFGTIIPLRTKRFSWTVTR
jgi:hypothetical protein